MPSTRPFGLSVVIPVYGRPDALRRAIASVQTAQPERVEVVVVDDGSPVDPRPGLPARNAAGVPVRVYRFARNRGPQAARNLGLRRARFEFVAFLDSDDAFTADKVDTVLASLAQEPADLLFHGVQGMPKYARLARWWDRRLRRAVPFHWWLALLNPVATPALVVRRRRRLGLPRLRHSEDWAYLLRYVDATTRVRYLDRELATVFRAAGAAGGLSGAAWRMRRGEFAARAVLLKSRRPADLARWALGHLAGALRIAADLLRGRYWR